MDRIYFTITGTYYYHGKEFLEKDMQVKLIKEPDNKLTKKRSKWSLRVSDRSVMLPTAPARFSARATVPDGFMTRSKIRITAGFSLYFPTACSVSWKKRSCPENR